MQGKFLKEISEPLDTAGVGSIEDWKDVALKTKKENMKDTTILHYRLMKINFLYFNELFMKINN